MLNWALIHITATRQISLQQQIWHYGGREISWILRVSPITEITTPFTLILQDLLIDSSSRLACGKQRNYYNLKYSILKVRFKLAYQLTAQQKGTKICWFRWIFPCSKSFWSFSLLLSVQTIGEMSIDLWEGGRVHCLMDTGLRFYKMKKITETNSSGGCTTTDECIYYYSTVYLKMVTMVNYMYFTRINSV